ncbi:hypothetical protein GXW82_37165 [Streptacidiphilus sp. 4-A2]|nr:hypothetical protein [Streptacidiphilus sp. 4-A2]
MSDTLDSAGWPHEQDGLGHGVAERRGSGPRPGFLASPFSGRTWRESLQGC